MTRARFATLTYHDVVDEWTTSGFQRPGAMPFKLDRGRFLAHLQSIAATGCTPSLITETDPESPHRYVAFTFDDGGESSLWVADQLDRLGWRAHFFVVTSLIGTIHFLDKAGIRELRTRGHMVGSHSHTHPDIFRDLAAPRMLDEWRTSRDILADLLAEPCVVASLPGGDSSRETLLSAEAARFRYFFTSEPQTTPRRIGNCWVVGRFAVKSHTRARRVRELAEFRGWQRASLLRRVKVAARRMAPSLYRMYVSRSVRDGESR